MSVAQTIFAQLGSGGFVMMTGARKFVSHEDGLSFRLPGAGGFCKDGINHVRVTLTPADLYTVTFSRIRGVKVTEVAKVEDVYNDQLREVFRNATGLENRAVRFAA